MKRFKIRNKLNGLKFQIESDQFPSVLQPEWGIDPEVVEEDMSSELAEESRKEGVRSARKIRLRQLAQKLKNDTSTAAEEKEALKHVLLELVKDLD